MQMEAKYLEGSSVALWMEFFKRYYWDKVLNLAYAYPEEKSLIVEYPDIVRFSSDLADELIERPSEVLRSAEEALRSIDIPDYKKLEQAHVRIIKLEKKTQIRHLRSMHISKLIAIEGLVRNATEVRPRIVEAAFKCMRCGHVTRVPQPSTKFMEPLRCEDENCDRKGPFELLQNESKFIDAQKLTIQESPEDLKGGEQPQTLVVDVEDDLAGKVTPGNRLIVVGILRQYQRTTSSGKTTFYDVYLECNSIELIEQEFEELEITKEEEEEIYRLSQKPDIYEKIIKSIAPSIYGYEEIKEAIALQLVSGVEKFLPDSSRIRGDIHIILIGDPGVAKSQLLRYVVNLAPRGIYTSGKSTTSAGLTATAVRDEFGDGRWTLEAGALVLADRGIAAVDEIDKMSPEDRSALHEAMEQQTISVAKAGIMATLKSRCALLAAANPKGGRFDPFEPIANQINLPPALLSRFDLIFPISDKPNVDVDSKMADHILKAHYAGELAAHAKRNPRSNIAKEAIESAMQPIKPEIEPELLRKYIAVARRIIPILTDEARESLINFYLSLRRQGEGLDSPVPVTARQLEALVRLAEASARLRLSDKITTEDAMRVIRIVENCLNKVARDPETGKFDVDIIAVGTSKSQRDKIKILKDVIRALEREFSGAAPREEVIKRTVEEGIEREKVEELITKLKQLGDIYEPVPGKTIKLT
ncbi:MAG: minichromosome maintenance protein MCM [Methanocellales archaeon]